MPQKSRLNLPPVNLGEKTIGERIANFRKKKGWTQNQLAEKIGLTQGLISAYENDTRKLSAEMIARFAITFNVTTDKIIGLQLDTDEDIEVNLRLMKRIHKISVLPKSKQKMILRTLDTLIHEATTAR